MFLSKKVSVTEKRFHGYIERKNRYNCWCHSTCTQKPEDLIISSKLSFKHTFLRDELFIWENSWDF